MSNATSNAEAAATSGPRIKFMAILTGATLLAGCAVQTAGPTAVSRDMATPAIASGWNASYADDPTIAAAIESISSREIDAEAAVRLALLANPALHRKYFELRVVPAAIAAAALRPASETHIETQFAVEIAGRARRSTAETEALKFEGTKLEIAADIVRTGLDVRRAHVSAVAARQTAALAADLKTASEASAELGRRMARVGNWPRLNEFREAAALGEVSVQVARALQGELVAKERLVRQIGLLRATGTFALPGALPPLPGNFSEEGDAASGALARRFDLRAMLFDLAAEIRELELDGYKDGTLAATARFVPLPGPVPLVGTPSGALRVPLYELGSQTISSKSAAMMEMLTRLSIETVRAEADARESGIARRAAYDIAAHYARHMVPLQARIVDEAVQRYNGMLIGVFDLLSVARARTAVDLAAVEALRDYWTAAADSVNALRVGGYAGGMPVADGGAPKGAQAAPH